MRYVENRAEDVRIAYIGGGSRGWAWGLMSDLAAVDDMNGTVALYDIDREAAEKNAVIGNRMKELPDCRSAWDYQAADSLGEALTGADFVVISILPGTFDEMESDVHAPEKYGIYQSVGDTAGPGGLVRALRTIPMFEEIAAAIRDFCPDAWVINYTNPMTVCVRTLYRVFPKIKAFGCCHEVFGTQKLLSLVLKDMLGIEGAGREETRVNVVGVNHFTWLTEAKYRDVDLFPLYRKFCEKYAAEGFSEKADDNWMNNSFASRERVKMDLFLRFGAIAAAGDRHLAEFCPGSWYLKDPQTVKDWCFGLTTVDWRKEDLKNRLARSERLYSGEEAPVINQTGEEGVQQMRAILGLRDLVTNVNIPNQGQIPNLPLGAVVETNAHFSADSVRPVFAGPLPESIYPLVSRVSGIQELIVEAALNRDLEQAFTAFQMDPNMNLSMPDARKLFDEMVENTRKYLGMYFA
ncbi:MAG TPA: alpha-glucosidase/alpha-galactosidase [Candidatus Eisenbergiella merdavium]|uniref:Alpha-glucosidase/alpha-galactosidase n=1 Tax=Candidatus Eisenbergiella merdavium TaxID=2838551 RepID=A0A9D2SRF8_9FIRM|nr:alpha-glucosidase/alpha-galactosidase [Candidatus Eisenbergiella merdavium]